MVWSPVLFGSLAILAASVQPSTFLGTEEQASSSIPGAAELSWLRSSLVPGLEKNEKLFSSLVSHRGFHNGNSKDNHGITARPMEDSIAAYEQSWSSGFKFAETDIIVTADEGDDSPGVLVLNHDDSMERISLLGAEQEICQKTSLDQLTTRQVGSIATQGWDSAPLLTEALKRAALLSTPKSTKQIVVEIKYGNPGVWADRPYKEHPAYRTALALKKLFLRFFESMDPDTGKSNVELLRHVALVFSFEKQAVDAFAKMWAGEIQPKLEQYNFSNPKGSLPKPPIMLLTKIFKPDRPSLYNINFNRIGKDNKLFSDEFLKVVDDEETGSWPAGVGKNALFLDGIYMEFQPEMLGYPSFSCGIRNRGIEDNSPLNWIAQNPEYADVPPLKEGEGYEELKKIINAKNPVTGEGIKVGVYFMGQENPFDRMSAAEELVYAGVSWVNTDIPKEFLQPVPEVFANKSKPLIAVDHNTCQALSSWS